MICFVFPNMSYRGRLQKSIREWLFPGVQHESYWHESTESWRPKIHHNDCHSHPRLCLFLPRYSLRNGSTICLMFTYILNFLRRRIPPIFWTRTEGFDFPLYAALLEEARYFGVGSLEEWIVTKKYMESVGVSQSIEVVDLKSCLGGGLRQHPDDRIERFHPSDYETKGGLVRKRLEVQHWTFTAPVSTCVSTDVFDTA